MGVPAFIKRLREKIGHDLLWLPGVTAVVPPSDQSGLVFYLALLTAAPASANPAVG